MMTVLVLGTERVLSEGVIESLVFNMPRVEEAEAEARR